MDEKQYDPARNNEKSPAEGMASVNTHNPGEEEYPKTGNQIPEEEKNAAKQKHESQDAS